MKKGYTLIELLVTIGIMSVLLGIGTINFTSIRVQNQADLVAAQVRSEIMRTQSEAINQIDSGVYFEADRIVYFLGDTYVEGVATNEQTDMPRNISLSSITLTDSTTTFDPITGYLENFSDPAMVVISGPGATHTVLINQWGTVSIE